MFSRGSDVRPGAAPVSLGLRCDLCGICVCAAVICVAGAVLWCSPSLGRRLGMLALVLGSM